MNGSASLLEAIAKAGRTLWGTVVLRFLFGLIFLFVAFNEFPNHKWTIGLGLVVFNISVGMIAETLSTLQLQANRLDDMAERKTRHTIILAAERAGTTNLNTWEFWSDVERRVDAELGEPQKVSVPASIGLVVGRILWQAVADLVGIAILVGMTNSA